MCGANQHTGMMPPSQDQAVMIFNLRSFKFKLPTPTPPASLGCRHYSRASYALSIRMQRRWSLASCLLTIQYLLLGSLTVSGRDEPMKRGDGTLRMESSGSELLIFLSADWPGSNTNTVTLTRPEPKWIHPVVYNRRRDEKKKELPGYKRRAMLAVSLFFAFPPLRSLASLQACSSFFLS